MTECRVRISKVTLKTGGAPISLLRTRPAPDDSNFIPTLIWLLEQARMGKVVGYALVCTLESEDGERRRCCEAARAWDEGDEHHVLGLIRRMEAGYIKRTWGADE